MVGDRSMPPNGRRERAVGTQGRVTIREVASSAGVSVATASRALNDTGRMSTETRQRIRTTAERLGYRPNSMARGLVQKRSFTVGLITNDTYGRFTLPVAAGLSEAMVDRGVSLFLATTQDDPELARRTFAAMEEKCVDGLIVANRRVDRMISLPERGLHTPTVYVMSACPEGAIGFNPDDHGGARAATEHLLASGRKRIAHVTGPEKFAASRYRVAGWREAMDTAGLAPWGEAIHGQWSEAYGFAIAAHLFAERPGRDRPDGVVCGNDQIARGVMDGAERLGVAIPDDCGVVGFDNWEIFATASRPPLTTVDMGLVELGHRAGLTLLDTIDGRTVAPGLRLSPCEVVVRQSCGIGGDRKAA